MKRIIYISMSLLLLTLSVSAEDVSLQAAIDDAGTITMTVTLDEANPAIMDNYSSIGPGPSTVPEPSTLMLLALGIVGLVGWRRFRKA